MPTFNYEFEELPLVVAPGVEAALINGQAEIEYGYDGNWQILNVMVEGHRQLTQEERAAGVKPWVYIPAHTAIDALVVGRLGHEWRSKVNEAVTEQIEGDRESRADDYADYRRERLDAAE